MDVAVGAYVVCYREKEEGTGNAGFADSLSIEIVRKSGKTSMTYPALPYNRCNIFPCAGPTLHLTSPDGRVIGSKHPKFHLTGFIKP